MQLVGGTAAFLGPRLCSPNVNMVSAVLWVHNLGISDAWQALLRMGCPRNIPLFSLVVHWFHLQFMNILNYHQVLPHIVSMKQDRVKEITALVASKVKHVPGTSSWLVQHRNWN